MMRSQRGCAPSGSIRLYRAYQVDMSAVGSQCGGYSMGHAYATSDVLLAPFATSSDPPVRVAGQMPNFTRLTSKKRR